MSKSQISNVKISNPRSSILRSAAGFSMIEVLVASTILTVIVLMLGMLFQQTSLAWRTGVRKADSFMQVRSAVGAIQRDAAAAVDARFLPQSFLDGQQKFSGSAVLFYTLTGGVEVDNNGTATYNRNLKRVTYDSAGNRTEKTLKGSGTWGVEKRSNVLTFAERQSSQNRPSVSLQEFLADYGKPSDRLDSDGLPLAMTFLSRVTSSGNSLDIGAASAGPDRVWNTKDDIKTWVED